MLYHTYCQVVIRIILAIASNIYPVVWVEKVIWKLIKAKVGISCSKMAGVKTGFS